MLLNDTLLNEDSFRNGLREYLVYDCDEERDARQVTVTLDFQTLDVRYGQPTVSLLIFVITYNSLLDAGAS